MRRAAIPLQAILLFIIGLAIIIMLIIEFSGQLDSVGGFFIDLIGGGS